MNLPGQIAEERLLAALRRGEFDHLEGAGKAFDLHLRLESAYAGKPAAQREGR